MEEVVKYLIEFKFSQKTILEILGLTIIYEIPEDKLLPRITENLIG